MKLGDMMDMYCGKARDGICVMDQNNNCKLDKLTTNKRAVFDNMLSSAREVLRS